MNRTLIVVALAACNYTPREATPPASFTAAEAIPARPTDTAQPLQAVTWMLNYDVSQFDTVWRWLHDDVPQGPERARAIAAASLVAVAELDRTDARAEGLAAFDEAIPKFPDDARLPLWRAYIVFLAARDATEKHAALEDIRKACGEYQGFTPFGFTLAVANWEDAPREVLEEARTWFDIIVTGTAALQHATQGLDLERSRRLWDTPIAPYNISAMQAMIGDLELRLGRKDKASVGYFTALRSNNAARWPWGKEVQRRMEHLDETTGDFSVALGTRFNGRIGNGSCTVCHTHVSTFDLGEPAANVGWVKVRISAPKEVPNLQGVALLLPDSTTPIPGGFAIGPTVDVAAPRDFPTRDELFDGTAIIPAEPGVYFVAAQSQVDGKTWQGYLPREFGKQWFLTVTAGQLLDVSESPIVMRPLPDP